MKQKRVAIIALTLVIIAVISGCGNGLRLNYDVFTKGDALLPIMIGVKSNQTDFKIDEITLDFYYGSRHELVGYSEESDLKECGVGIYLCNAKDFKPILQSNGSFFIENYSEIAGLHFVRFIDMEEYNSTEYGLKLPRFGTPKYNHKETLTIPSSIIDRDSKYWGRTYFCLIIMRIVYNNVQYKYGYDHWGCLGVEYKFLDDDTVRLSEPAVTVF